MCYQWKRRWRPPELARDFEPGDARLLTDGGEPDDTENDDEDGDGDASEPSVPQSDAVSRPESGSDGDADGGNENAGETETTEGSSGDESGEETHTGGDEGDDDGPSTDRANVEVTDAGGSEPATPEWEEPDLEEIPEFELGGRGPIIQAGTESDSGRRAGDSDTDRSDSRGPGEGEASDPTAGMPNTARTPEATRISSAGTEAYFVAFELCARLPDDVRLPEEAADLVPAAVEAELEQDVQTFAATEFDTQRPHVDTLSFEEVDGDVWLRLRIGLPPEGFADLDPEKIRSYALERLEGVF